MATCTVCQKSGFGFFEVKEGACPSCPKAAERAEASKSDAEREREKRADAERRQAVAAMPVTTETYVGDVERLGLVASEVVLGMNVFRDVLANLRDLVGGRSGAVQQTLREARDTALTEARAQAAELGGDMIVALDVDYHSISTGGSVNMMLVSVAGTAVKLRS